MKTYKVLKTIMLSFLTPQDQYDAMFDPGTIIKSDGHTIWLMVVMCDWRESITTANAIDHWLEDKKIEET